MKLKEQNLWARMRGNLPSDILLERVENLLAKGFPDVVACAGAGRVTMVELKAVHEAPARPGTPLLGDEGLSIDQRNWHMAWRKAGGTSLLVASCGRGNAAEHFAVRDCMGEFGMQHFEVVNDWSLGELIRRAAIVGRGATFWPALAAMLRGDA